MKVVNSTINDIDEIFRLYGLATQLQSLKFPDTQWPEFDRDVVMEEITKQQQFKLMSDGKIACVWAISFSDPQIWEEKNTDPALYIHRIATNPEFKGQNLVAKIVQWSKRYAREQQKQYIRMDTCGNNEKLIQHYTNNGFKFLGIKKLEETSNLPAHYHDALVCFFEMKL